MATLRELVVSLGLDFDASGFTKADAAIKVLKTGFLGVGSVFAGVAAGLTGITIAMSRQADELNDFSKTIGVGTDALQKLGYAAQLSGSSAETMREGLLFLARNAEAASGGSKEAAGNFAKFGVSLKDQNGHLKTADRLFLDVAKGASGMADGSEKAALSAALLGRSAGPQLVELLSQGEEGIAALGDELEQLGGLMDTDFIEASAELNDTLDRANAIIKGLGLTVARTFMPIVQRVVKGFVEWYKVNRQVINNALVFFVERLSSALEGVGQVIKLVATAFGKFTEDASPFGRVLMLLAATALLLGLAFASPAFAILLLSALIGSVFDDINEFITGGESVLGDFVNFMRKWGKDQGGVFGDLIETIFGFIQFFQGIGWDGVTKEMTEAIDVAVKFWADKFKWLTDKISAAKSALGLGDGPSAQGGAGGGQKFNMMQDAGDRYWGEGGPLSAIARPSGGSGGSTTNSIVVNAAPGQSEEQVATLVAQKIEEKQKQQLVAARAALIPAGAR